MPFVAPEAHLKPRTIKVVWVSHLCLRFSYFGKSIQIYRTDINTVGASYVSNPSCDRSRTQYVQAIHTRHLRLSAPPVPFVTHDLPFSHLSSPLSSRSTLVPSCSSCRPFISSWSVLDSRRRLHNSLSASSQDSCRICLVVCLCSFRVSRRLFRSFVFALFRPRLRCPIAAGTAADKGARFGV